MLPVYTVTIFLSASLLFLVQPMAAKMLLPLLGGSPAVWNTSMVFFQAVLLLGYVYAHVLGRAGARRQVLIHACVLIVPLAAFAALGRLPVADPRRFDPPGGVPPAVWLLGALAAAVGVPFFVLSTTGPLMQRWFAATTHRHARDPYFLYAASNVGSMLALLGYPFVMERQLALQGQRGWFSAGYVVFGALAIACGVLMLRGRAVGPVSRQERRRIEAQEGSPAPEAPPAGVSNLARVRWVLLAAVPSSLMLGVTQHVSSDIAAVPLMWVLPLALYLLTFIVAFSGRGVPVAHLSLLYLAVAGFIGMSLLTRMERPLWAIIAMHFLGLFLGALVCHGRLAQERPGVDRLTEFYLLVALGGVIGGSFNALLAPVVFDVIAEYPIALAAACLLTPPSFGERALPAGDWRAWLLGSAREIAWFVLVALAWVVVFEWARGGVRDELQFWLVFGGASSGVAGYCLWRARSNPIAPDLLAPVATLLYLAGLQYPFRHVAPVGEWPAEVAVYLAAGAMVLRLALRSGAGGWALDVLVPAMIALSVLAAFRATAEAGLTGQIKYAAWFGLAGLLLVLSIGRRVRTALGIMVVAALSYDHPGSAEIPKYTSRTFFGVHRVADNREGTWRVLSHGTTRHGLQILIPQLTMKPTMYYHPTGPIGEVFRSRWDDPAFDRVGIIGLGAGGIAAYGQAHQRFTFYEIDPEVVWIARDSGYFTFLEGTEAKVEIELGDGRLKLGAAPAGGYDLIIVDAFSSDSIPLHLITREAVRLYFDKLAGDGLVAFHVSNRYLDLRWPLGAIAQDLGLMAATMDEPEDRMTPQDLREGKLATTWVVLARRLDDFRGLREDDRWMVYTVPPETPLWTDDYSNILSAFDWSH